MEINDAKTMVETIINKNPELLDGIDAKTMAQESQQNIINAQKGGELLRIPGNRKNRRKMMKQLKIPKYATQICTKKEADEYTREHYKLEENTYQR